MDSFWFMFMNLGYLFCAEGLIQSALRRNEYSELFRHLLHLDGKFIGLCGGKRITHETKSKIALWILRINVVGTFVFIILLTLVFIKRPTSFFYIYDLYPDHESWAIFSIFLVFEILSKSIGVIAFNLMSTWFLLSVAFQFMALAQLRKSTDHVGKRIAYYKYLAIFNKCHMNCYLPITLPSRLTLFGLLVVISAHLLLRYGHRLILFERFLVFQLLLWSIVTAFLCILVSGKIYKSSSRALVRFRSYDKHTKYTRKSLRALRPFGVKAGPSKTLTYGTLNAYSVVVLKALTTILVRFPPR
ncbi:hypothetical protein Fcan01_01585 [Folsomia candida]|uniref:Uncharacterized protein n=2 Tax=Folsomia candida TaxID=158441 RepID=A0A226F6I6_FOLCA|nr:hypothetical protein Fcan01_01585 [Folsomia candida]